MVTLVHGVDIQGWLIQMYMVLARLRLLPTGLHQIFQLNILESYDRDGSAPRS